MRDLPGLNCHVVEVLTAFRALSLSLCVVQLLCSFWPMQTEDFSYIHFVICGDSRRCVLMRKIFEVKRSRKRFFTYAIAIVESLSISFLHIFWCLWMRIMRSCVRAANFTSQFPLDPQMASTRGRHLECVTEIAQVMCQSAWTEKACQLDWDRSHACLLGWRRIPFFPIKCWSHLAAIRLCGLQMMSYTSCRN